MNTPDFREIERKFVSDRGYDATREALHLWVAGLDPRAAWDAEKDVDSLDLYWQGRIPASFVRLRDNRYKYEMTYKQKDRHTNLDRLEINVELAARSDFRLMTTILTRLTDSLPVMVAAVRTVWALTDDGTIAVYRIEGDVYVEVEARTRDRVDELCADLKKWAPFLEAEPRSIFEIYCLKSP